VPWWFGRHGAWPRNAGRAGGGRRGRLCRRTESDDWIRPAESGEEHPRVRPGGSSRCPCFKGMGGLDVLLGHLFSALREFAGMGRVRGGPRPRATAGPSRGGEGGRGAARHPPGPRGAGGRRSGAPSVSATHSDQVWRRAGTGGLGGQGEVIGVGRGSRARWVGRRDQGEQ
jgi:hypothetical protein